MFLAYCYLQVFLLLIGGYANEAAGGSFLGGWIGGLISGIMSAIPGLNIIGGMVGGMLGNIATGLIDKYAYGRNISGIELVYMKE